VDRCGAQRAHFMQHNRYAGLRELPGRFGSGKPASDHVNGWEFTCCHPVIIRLMRRTLQW
jgi:hypothetical protein